MSDVPSLTGATWIHLHAAEHLVRRLRSAGLSEVAATCAAIRWGTKDELEGSWLDPSASHLHDPFEMAGMEQAVARLERAAQDGERVRIITDYDVDGTTSSLILQAVLRLIGPRVQLDYHVPNRMTEGYGFSVEAAQAALDDKVDLVVTADIGVRDHAAVARAREGGADVLICDHHLPEGASVPDGAIILCPPQQGCSYPNPHLAACGISLKLAQALLRHHPRRTSLVNSLLKLAAIGTVADLVPLTTLENRAIVSIGLLELNRGPHAPGLHALITAAGLRCGEIKETDLGFRIGPRINAAGRMSDASLVIRLLTTRDRQEAQQLASELERFNLDRRRVQEQLVDTAMAQVGEVPPSFVLVSGAEGEGWHRGVVGIVASRLKERLHRPCAVVSEQGELAVGSLRSVSGVHAIEALDSAADLLVKYGGHPAAAGFTVPRAALSELHARLCAFVDAVGPEALVPVRNVDAEIDAERLDDRLHADLHALGPFGMGNPRPRLVIRGVRPRGVRQLGRDGRMVKFMVDRPGSAALEAIWWDRAQFTAALTEHPVDLLGNLGINTWRGEDRLQFRVTDARRSR